MVTIQSLIATTDKLDRNNGISNSLNRFNSYYNYMRILNPNKILSIYVGNGVVRLINTDRNTKKKLQLVMVF